MELVDNDELQAATDILMAAKHKRASRKMSRVMIDKAGQSDDIRDMICCCLPARTWCCLSSEQERMLRICTDHLRGGDRLRGMQLWKRWHAEELAIKGKFGGKLQEDARVFRLRTQVLPRLTQWRKQRFLTSAERTQAFLDKKKAIIRWRANIVRMIIIRDEERDYARLAAPFKYQERWAFVRWWDYYLPVAEYNRKLNEAMDKARFGNAKTRIDFFLKWHKIAQKMSHNKRRLRNGIMHFSPEGRALLRGFDAFAMRVPRWETGSKHARIKLSGAKVVHERSRMRDGAIGSPVIRDGVYRFAFMVGGGGSGVVIGVTDANLFSPSGNGDRSRDETEVDNVSSVWGLSLTHGALYTKKGTGKGKIGTQTIAPPLSRWPPGEVLHVEVEVDMRARRIAFGVNGSQLTQASITMPSEELRPWVFMWNYKDSVMLLPRRRQKRSSMALLPPRTPIAERLPTYRESLRLHESLRSPSFPSPSPSYRHADGTATSPEARANLTSRGGSSTQRGMQSSRSTARGAPFSSRIEGLRSPDDIRGRPESPPRRLKHEETDDGDTILSSPSSPSPWREGEGEKDVELRPDLFGRSVLEAAEAEIYSNSPRNGSPRGLPWDWVKIAFVKRVTSLYQDVYHGL